jgi:AcrR family transcriptional regulator
MKEWGVAMATATKALAALGREAVVRAVPGVGTIVADPERGPAPRVRRVPASRARDTTITRERIVRAAIDIADAEGLSALSMRRVAAELDVPTMSLYRHVPNKDELVQWIAEEVFGESAPPRPSGDWRAQLTTIARLQWATYHRHPWLSQVIGPSFTRPVFTPNAMAHTEWTMRALDGTALDLTTMLFVAITLAGYVQGTALKLVSELEAQEDTGLTSDEWMEAQRAQADAAFASGAFPFLARLSAGGEVDVNLDSLLEFGLERMLDGVAALIDAPKKRARR